MLRLLLAVVAGLAMAPSGRRVGGASAGGTYTTYLPAVSTAAVLPGGCEPLPGACYASLTVNDAPSPYRGVQHPDLNPALRGYTGPLHDGIGLIDNCGALPDDPLAPQLRGLFGDHRRPTFASVHRVYQWDWERGCPRPTCENPQWPSYAEVVTMPGELLSVPPSGYSIDDAQGLEVLVLYASEDWVTLKYTREDDVRRGYTLHLRGVCLDPTLQALYDRLEAAGRGQLPALKAGQAFGRARGTALGIAIRDCGSWMDPRNCHDWWRL